MQHILSDRSQGQFDTGSGPLTSGEKISQEQPTEVTGVASAPKSCYVATLVSIAAPVEFRTGRRLYDWHLRDDEFGTVAKPAICFRTEPGGSSPNRISLLPYRRWSAWHRPKLP